MTAPPYNPVATPLGKDNPALGWPVLDDWCCLPENAACAVECCCGVTERVLCAYIAGACAVAMTTKQRDWCLNQIGQVEGRVMSEYAFDTDVELARAVLDAWADYARDKGIL